jgi:hypothetical protein
MIDIVYLPPRQSIAKSSGTASCICICACLVLVSPEVLFCTNVVPCVLRILPHSNINIKNV